MTLRTVFILFYFFPCITFGQSNESKQDIKSVTVWFKGNSIKLTQGTKATLDLLIRQIKNDTALYVQAISYNKDFCDKCGVRSWKRATAVLTYLYNHGISDNRLTFTNRLEGELNKVDLFLTSIKPISITAPINKRQNK